MDRRARIAIIAILAILILFLYIQFGYRKNRAEITELRNRHAAVTDSLRNARAVAAKLEEMQKRLKKLEQQWVKAQEMLPTQKEIPDLLRSITTVGEKAGAKFLLFQPLPVQRQQYYTEIPIQLSVRSTYHSLGNFLSALGNLPRIVNVSQLSLRPIEEDRATIEANFRATTYVLAKPGSSAQPRRPRAR